MLPAAILNAVGITNYKMELPEVVEGKNNSSPVKVYYKFF